jgi:predicted transcriptional regulator
MKILDRNEKEITKGDVINLQQKLFHDIVVMKHRIQGLGGFVQNDFERMLEDGTITKDDIREGIEDMDKSFDKVINEMKILREKCKTIMTYYST